MPFTTTSRVGGQTGHQLRLKEYVSLLAACILLVVCYVVWTTPPHGGNKGVTVVNEATNEPIHGLRAAGLALTAATASPPNAPPAEAAAPSRPPPPPAAAAAADAAPTTTATTTTTTTTTEAPLWPPGVSKSDLPPDPAGRGCHCARYNLLGYPGTHNRWYCNMDNSKNVPAGCRPGCTLMVGEGTHNGRGICVAPPESGRRRR